MLILDLAFHTTRELEAKLRQHKTHSEIHRFYYGTSVSTQFYNDNCI